MSHMIFSFPDFQTVTYAAAITLTLFIAVQLFSRFWTRRSSRQ
jgi:hypothetical protein